MKTRLILANLAAVAMTAGVSAAPVTDWGTTNGDAGFTAGTAATNSPVTTDADGDAIAANFATVTLADQDFVKLTGSFSVNVTLPDGQFRFGLFDGDNPVTAGDGGGYVGYYLTVFSTSPPGTNAGNILRADGSATNPFSGGQSTEIKGDADTFTSAPVTANEVLDFEFMIARDGTAIDITAAVSSQTGNYEGTWDLQDTAASPATFTYDSVAFLLGGSTNGTQATFTNIDVSTGVVPEPGSLALLGLGGLLIARRRRG